MHCEDPTSSQSVKIMLNCLPEHDDMQILMGLLVLAARLTVTTSAPTSYFSVQVLPASGVDKAADNNENVGVPKAGNAYLFYAALPLGLPSCARALAWHTA